MDDFLRWKKWLIAVSAIFASVLVVVRPDYGTATLIEQTFYIPLALYAALLFTSGIGLAWTAYVDRKLNGFLLTPLHLYIVASGIIMVNEPNAGWTSLVFFAYVLADTLLTFFHSRRMDSS